MEKLRNLQAEHITNRWIVLAALTLSVLFSAFVWWQSEARIEENRSRIYVLENGKSLLLASRTGAAENRPAEMRDHLSSFLTLAFTLSPDATYMNRNIDQALFLGDGSVSRFFDHLKDEKYYDQIIASSVSAHFRLDSIALDYAHYPYGATMYGRQEIVKSTTLSIRALVCRCTMRNVPRSDNNSHGLLIENFRVLDNKEIQSIERNTLDPTR